MQAGQHAGIFKVRFGLGEIEGRYRLQRYREIERHKNKETELTIKTPSKASPTSIIIILMSLISYLLIWISTYFFLSRPPNIQKYA
jgi:hypothetical protein